VHTAKPEEYIALVRDFLRRNDRPPR